MKRKLLALLLALTFCVGLAVPALAFWEYGYHEFREGLKPAMVNGEWNYVDENGQVVDLNQGRFVYCFAFYEGRAAVMDIDNKVGYIDRSGNLVVPCQYGAIFNRGEVWTGHFHDGKAVVFNSLHLSYDGFWDASSSDSLGTVEIGIIDQNGNLVEPFTAVDLSAGIYNKGLYLLCDNGATSDYYEDEHTEYQSTAKLTRVDVSDMDFNSFTVEVTNSGTCTDRGTVALVLASGMGTVHFIDYEVEPGVSKTYQVLATGHIGTNTGRLELISGLENYLDFSIVHFESDEDVAAFKSTIPQEIDEGHHRDGVLSWHKNYGVITLCYGTPGDEWLKTVGIGRMGQPYIYEDEDHSNCKP